MVGKIVALLLCFGVLAQVNSQITVLDDVTISHVSNPMFGVSIGIQKSWSETLQSCHLTVPNSITYEAYPSNNLPSTMTFVESLFPEWNVCSIVIKNASPDMSGTYELVSMVTDQEGTIGMTRQKYHITFTLSEVEFPTQ